MNAVADNIKPSLATIATAAAGTANAAVWMDVIKGWAALATTVIAVPTAVCMLLYWFLKLIKAG